VKKSGLGGGGARNGQLDVDAVEAMEMLLRLNIEEICKAEYNIMCG